MQHMMALKLQNVFKPIPTIEMQTEQITLGPITLIKGSHGSKFPYCNSLYVEEAGLVIDPSSNRSILEALHQAGKINTVCLTHCLEDHFRWQKWFCTVNQPNPRRIPA